MKNTRLALSLFLIVIGAAELRSQDTGVRSEYLKDDKATKVETNMLYLLNTGDQFLGMQFSGRFKGETLTSSPTVEITIYSFSKDPLYKKDKDRTLALIADGVEAELGILTVGVFKGETKNGVDTYYAVSGNRNVGMQVPLPQSAMIRAGGSMKGMTMELFTLQAKPDQILKLMSASDIQIRLGTTLFTPTGRHMQVIHGFAGQLTLKP
jgi:hypothetical protein